MHTISMSPADCKDFEIAENLTQLINERFNTALSQKTIVYVESEAQYRLGRAFRVRVNSFSSLYQGPVANITALKYQIKIVPAFVKKPNDIQEQALKPRNTRRKIIPLFDVSPEHVVAEAGPFRVILNKYCAVRNQILLTSVSLRSQSEALDARELSSVHRILKALPPNHLAFYNCGADSGASQPHKHVQIVPLGPMVYQNLFPVVTTSTSGKGIHAVFATMDHR